jgi:hypothetical protein
MDGLEVNTACQLTVRTDAAKNVDPAAQRFRATAQNEQTNCLSANGPRQGRSTIESDVMRVAGRFLCISTLLLG